MCYSHFKTDFKTNICSLEFPRNRMFAERKSLAVAKRTNIITHYLRVLKLRMSTLTSYKSHYIIITLINTF